MRTIPLAGALLASMLGAVFASAPHAAQLIDRTLAPNTANEGIALSLHEQVGAGRGDWFTVDSSSFLVSRDPFRAIRRGRQLFQRKFTQASGQGPVAGDGVGDVGAAHEQDADEPRYPALVDEGASVAIRASSPFGLTAYASPYSTANGSG